MAEHSITTAQPAESCSPAWQRPFTGVRARMLFWYILLLGLALVVSVLVLRQLLIVRLDERVDRVLAQEIDEFTQLAGGLDPATSEPFGDNIEALFRTFFARSVPDQNEVYLAIVDGEPLLVTEAAPYRIDTMDTAIGEWASATEPTWGTRETPEGPVRTLVVPVTSGEERLGTLVVAYFTEQERQEITEAVQLAALTSGGVLVVASVLAWLAAGRILAPLRDLERTARDITETELTERIDIEGNDEIAGLARTFNAMLDRLEEAFSLQRRFLDDIGHELHTPITIIRGHLEVPGDTPEEQAESHAVVTAELERMQRMVDDLLTLARAERPGFLQHEHIQLGELVDDAFSRATVLGDRRWRIDDVGPGAIYGDRQRLIQAAMNLVRNAVRHTSPDQEIGIGASVENGEARIWVRDTGPGIPPAEQERIFERFVQGARPTPGGSGLGLSIVRTIAAAHGGRIELRSQPDPETVFTIILPGAQDDA
ncbi:MAG: ATP-binding protein [Dehalococcoidia bacterium]|nr:ATP-binding protein [Dehalococcoidia bacterium]